MSSSTISIFGNKIFLEILNEIKLFSKYKVKYYDDMSLCVEDAENNNHFVVIFISEENKNSFSEIKERKFPLILVGESLLLKNISIDEIESKLNMPFTILDFKKKVITILAKNEFKKNSLINLNDYIVDKNERKIKKNNQELQLSEKEISFLILFSENKEPISKNLVLKRVWNYSSESETHTVETHIHRLRKKILKKFGDNNFIKNNNKGYYI
jgi:hypothetical protein